MNAYTPAGLLTLLAGGTGLVLVWVGVAVAAALALYFIFLGIRSGIRIFRTVAEERYYNEHGSYREGYLDSYGDGYVMSDYDRAETDSDWLAEYDLALADGLSHNQAHDWATSATDPDRRDNPNDELGM